MKSILSQTEIIKLPVYTIDVEFGQFFKREEVLFECNGYDVEADISVWFNHTYEESTNYSESKIEDVYVNSYRVLIDGKETDIELCENEIESKIIL